MTDTQFISLQDKPALLALTSPDWHDAAKAALNELGYKVHAAAAHGDFLTGFTQVPYQVVIIEDLFAANSMAENRSLTWLQTLPMGGRRHAIVILVGENFTTFSPMHAYTHSVHLVVARTEMNFLPQILQRVISENDLFLSPYREAQRRVVASFGKE